jgi:hypothetical protein
MLRGELWGVITMRKPIVLICALSAASASAATYQVGPSRPYTTLQAAFNALNLAPGDIVEVDGNQTYNVGVPGVDEGIIMRNDDSGAPGNPVTVRGVRIAGNRPILSGGTNTIEFRAAHHVVFENFEVTGTGNVSNGTFRCIFHNSNDLTIRYVLVRDCPRQGILGSDIGSGSLTVEFSEVRNAGSNGGNHAIYMSTDQVNFPGSVFRLQYSYLNDSRFDDNALGGNLIKSRAERNEIYHNWLEGAFYHELELIGPDPAGVAAGWSDALAREDSDIVGNVIVHSTEFGSVLRFGGDGTSGGRGESFGRYRFVNNTVIRIGGNNDRPTIFRLFEGIDSLEFHNNVIWREGSNGVTLVRAVNGEVQWVSVPKVRGSNNWIKSGFALNPTTLPTTLTGTLGSATSPFVDAANFDLRLTANHPAIDAGASQTVTPPDYELSNPLYPPSRLPVRSAQFAAAPRRAIHSPIDLGAFETPNTDVIFADGLAL